MLKFLILIGPFWPLPAALIAVMLYAIIRAIWPHPMSRGRK